MAPPESSAWRRVLIGSAMLMVPVLCGVGGLAVLQPELHAATAAAERFELIKDIPRVIIVPAETDLVDIMREVTDPLIFGTDKAVQVWPLEYQGILGGVAMKLPVPDGHKGEIVLAVGVLANGRVTGVHPVAHHETPGFGDAIEPAKSDWLQVFKGRSIGEPPRAAWRLARDGGEFDGISGATVTSRAVVGGVLRALTFFESFRANWPAPPGVPGALPGTAK